MRIIDTSLSLPKDLTTFEKDQVYNGLDCAVTLEVLNQLLPQLDNHTGATYNFSRELQGPALEMRLRGVLVDQERRAKVVDEFFDALEILERNLERIVFEGVGMLTFNWRSGPDLHKLFYDKLGIPAIKRGGRPTVDRAALEKIEAYTIARQIVLHIKAMRDIRKKLDVLQTGIDPDGWYRTSYNIAGTNTGRFSSSYSDFGTGGNLQNIEESLRSIFTVPRGYKMAKFDTKAGESFCVGGIEWNLFKDGRYLEACESGDPHTVAARVCWPKLPWTGILKSDKEIAEQPYYRHNSYRFMCKKLGHGSNYGGQPNTISNQTKIQVTVVEEFQRAYFKAFPAHLMWHGWVDQQIRKHGMLINLTGRKRQFWGRRNDPEVLREAIAYDPQGSLADIVNRAMLRIWRQEIATIYMHDHDATTWMFPEEIEDEIVPYLQENLVEEIPLQHGRVLRVPYDAQVGWNRGKYDAKKNPDGLRDYIPGDGQRKRSAKVHILDRQLR